MGSEIGDLLIRLARVFRTVVVVLNVCPVSWMSPARAANEVKQYVTFERENQAALPAYINAFVRDVGVLGRQAVDKR